MHNAFFLRKYLSATVCLLVAMTWMLPPSPGDFSVSQIFLHGKDVCRLNVGLSGKSVSPANLVAVSGGRVSSLANGRDSVTGWPLLYRLDVTGQVTIDVPCVIDQCRITVTGSGQGAYAVANNKHLDFIARDCDMNCRIGADGTVSSAVVNGVRVLQRCVISGACDGIKLGSPTGGALIEDCIVFGQIAIPGSHNDAIQMSSGVGGYNNWIVRRCRIEGPFRQSTSAMLVKSDFGDISGLTVQDCLLSGGTFTLYTRLSSKPFTLSRLQFKGCIWERNSWVNGPYSSDVVPETWLNNATGIVSTRSVDLPVVLSDIMPFPAPVLKKR